VLTIGNTYVYLETHTYIFPFIANFKCTPSDRQMYPRLGTPDLCQCDEPMHDSFCEIRSLRYNDPSKVRKCAVAPPDHLLSEISFSRTCNFPNFVSHVVYAAEPFYHRNRLTGCVTTWLRNCMRTKPTFAQCKHLLNIKFLRGKHCSEVTYSL